MGRRLAVLAILLTLLYIWGGVSVHASLATTGVFLIVFLLVFGNRFRFDERADK
jgi:hypothetical protein